MRTLRGIAVAFAIGAVGCFNTPGSSLDGNTPGSSNADEMQFDALEKSLAAGRTQALDKSALELHAIGDQVFWKTYETYAPKLHRRAAGATIDYQFSIGEGDDNNYRASSSYVVSALRDGDHVTYTAYDANAASTQVDEAQLPAPSDEQKWWAYAVSGNTIYIVTTGSETTLYRWQAGQVPAVLTTLEAAGAQVGEFFDFDVDGNTMTFIESGRLWSLDLTTKHATFLHNTTQISGAVAFGSDGAVYEDSDGLKYFEASTQTTRDLSMELQASSYKLNDTYDDIHYFYSATTGENFTRWKRWVVYTAVQGIFAYELDTKAVVPLLIDENPDDGPRIVYRYPVATDGGAGFFVGLTSPGGDVGADGPVYQIDLTKLLGGAS